MKEDEIDMYTRVYTREPRYYPVVDVPGIEVDKDEEDFRLIKGILDDMLYYYSHQYQNKKVDMLSNMTQIAKQMGDLNNRRLIAYCEIFPRILQEFSIILLNELEERRKK
jgi:hypothetical protein